MLVGKWHLGYPPWFGPLMSGYDEFYGTHSGGVDYYTHCDTSGQPDLWQGAAPVRAEGYVTDLFSRAAVDFVERSATGARAGRPFFLSLHYTAPHWPWETREDGRAVDTGGSLSHRSGGSIHTYRRMIHHMDEGIGWLREALRSHDLAQDTLVIFTSDNGGERFSDNWPLVGGKLDLTEGGIRVPWIACWPRRIGRGQVSVQHCMTMDWTATMLDAAGALPGAGALDGVSLLPVLLGAGGFSRPMFWRMKHRGQRALRDGDWKYLRVDGHDYLFDIEADERERANQAVVQPGRLADMRAAWERWNESLPPIPPDAAVLPGYSAADMPQR
jgi:arylsulfatase A-like enzyme